MTAAQLADRLRSLPLGDDRRLWLSHREGSIRLYLGEELIATARQSEEGTWTTTDKPAFMYLHRDAYLYAEQFCAAFQPVAAIA